MTILRPFQIMCILLILLHFGLQESVIYELLSLVRTLARDYTELRTRPNPGNHDAVVGHASCLGVLTFRQVISRNHRIPAGCEAAVVSAEELSSSSTSSDSCGLAGGTLFPGCELRTSAFSIRAKADAWHTVRRQNLRVLTSSASSSSISYDDEH